MKILTPKQERFCQEIVIGQMLSDAYDTAFQPRKASNKSINERASRLRKISKIVARIRELQTPVVAQVQRTLADRLNELACAMFLDPADCFDGFGRLLSIRAIPEHVRRAIAGYEVDPISSVTKIKFVDKLSAIMLYSKLAGGIPRERGPALPPRRAQFDLSRLTDEEFREYIRLRRKATIEPTKEVQATGPDKSKDCPRFALR